MPSIKLYNSGMANSLFIPGELERADKNCDRIVATIQSVGEPWTQVQFTLWYLNVHLSAKQARARQGRSARRLDATNNRLAPLNLRSDASKQLYDQGLRKVT